MSAGAIGGIVDDKSAFGLGLGATRRYAQLSDNKEIKRENKRRNERRRNKGQKTKKEECYAVYDEDREFTQFPETTHLHRSNPFDGKNGKMRRATSQPNI